MSLTEYDGHGRVSKRWLPALATPQRVILPGLHTVTYLDAHVRPEGIMPGSSEANLGDGAPYSEVIYDGSPLDRPLMEYGSGEAWRQAGRGILSEHMGNSAGDERLVCHRPCQPLAAERGGLGLVLILLVTNHVCLILKLIIRMKNRYRSGEAALPFFPFRYNKDNTLILCRCA